MNEEVKPGIRSTEFWVQLIPLVLGILLTTGVIDVAQQEALSSGADSVIYAVDQIVGAVMASLAAFGYSRDRSKVKSAASEARAKPAA